MKPFALDPSYTSMSGVFYPSGHVFALFEDAQAARQAAQELESGAGEAMYAAPETILKDIVRTLGSSGAPLPSVGADGDFVRRIADLASAGKHGLLMKVGKHDDAEQLGATLERAGAVAAFYYRTLVIEELVDQPRATTAQSVTVGTRAAAPQPGDE